MIYSLSGKINIVDENVATVDVNGVAYEVICSSSTIGDLSGKQSATVYTYLQVREDGVSLFGFSSLEEKKMFLNLISVSGIGPKMAISILSGITPKMLAGAVANSNVAVLTKIKGLGKKTAERLVLELKEKVESVVKGENNPIDGFTQVKVEDISFTQEMLDAVAILTELGIKKEEATKMVKSKATAEDKVEEIIRKCL
ncbi:MAG: Holliday junction branch migration protein RuvA [Clostridia bacterium]|nr:Holliday junction branch migration protein RuvA [Clostridia bacterium]